MLSKYQNDKIKGEKIKKVETLLSQTSISWRPSDLFFFGNPNI
jgi:hypothetical protein